jgi:hypothetical protein
MDMPARIFAETGARPLARRERRPLNQAASATRGDGSVVNLTVVDLSNDGCGILSTVNLSIDERLELAVAGRGKTPAIVRWVDGDRAGLSFATDGEAVPDETPRQHARVSVDGEVSMRRAGKLSFRVHIYDLSPDGCKAEFVERPEMGEQLWIKFDGMEALEAKVCWIGGPKAGLKFARPLYAAVFDLLLGKMRAAA